MKASLLVAAVTAVVAALLVPSLGLGGGDGRKVTDAKVLAGVTEPYTGAANAIRGLPGGGLPWQVGEASATLRSDGRLQVEVRGLVLATRAPVPAALQGVNPIAKFKAIVSCQTSVNGLATVSNVSTPLVDASRAGDADIEANLDLPQPCLAPIVFVTNTTGAWFAVSGR